MKQLVEKIREEIKSDKSWGDEFQDGINAGKESVIDDIEAFMEGKVVVDERIAKLAAKEINEAWFRESITFYVEASSKDDLDLTEWVEAMIATQEGE